MQVVIPRPLMQAAFTPEDLANNAASYSLEGSASDSTYRIDGSNRLYYVADRSGNSAVNGLVLPGVVANYGWLEAENYALADLDVQCEVASNSYAADEGLVERDNDGATNRVFLFRITAAGLLRFLWFPTGASASQIAQNSTAAITTRVAAYGKIWARATLDCDNGAGGYDLKFWTSPDGVMWSQLGSTVTGVGTTSLFTTSSIVTIGAIRSGATPGAANMLSGIVYRARAYATIGGSTPVFDVNFTNTAKLATSFTDTSANAAAGTVAKTVIALPARIHGARDLYQGLTASMPTYLAPYSVTGDILTDTAPVNAPATRPWDTFTADSNKGFTAGTVSNTTETCGWENAVAVEVGKKYTVTFDLVVNSGSLGSGLTVMGASSLAANPPSSGRTTTATVTAAGSHSLTLFGTVADAAADLTFYVLTGITVNVTISNVTWSVAGSSTAYAYFDGTADYLKSAPFTLSQPTSVYFTGSQVSWTDQDRIFDGDAANSMGLIQNTTTPNIAAFAGGFGGQNAGWAVGVRAVISALFSGAASFTRIDLGSSVAGASTGTTAANGFTIGIRGATVNYWGNITWSQTLLRSVADDTAMSTRIIRYFMRLGGIS